MSSLTVDLSNQFPPNKFEKIPTRQEEFGCCKRIVGVAGFILISAIAILVISSLGSIIGTMITGKELSLFDLLNFAIRNVNTTDLMIAGASLSLLIGGASFIIHRVKNKEDPLINSKIGKLWGSDKIQEIQFRHALTGDGLSKGTAKIENGKLTVTWNEEVDSITIGSPKLVENKEKGKALQQSDGTICIWFSDMDTVFVYKDQKLKIVKREIISGYLDRSTLEGEPGKKTGKAYMYGIKECRDHYSVSTLVTLSVPLYMIGTIAVNLIKLLGSILFIPICMTVEAFKTKSLFERKFEPEDILKTPALCLARIVVAPFYATAYVFALLYSLIDPSGGRKLATSIEKDWSGGITRAEGFWSVQGTQELWPGWTHFLGPKGMQGTLGFYMGGCHSPFGVATFEEGEITRFVSLSKAVEDLKKDPEASSKGHEYEIVYLNPRIT